ncbi:PIG-L family deacetylase [Streptomyces brevispora]|uniref:ricin-type beta-trefoil lectin domain protein n=1 Tax=Streptomyces brevispora TaxID=887462 RepID=UPI002E36D43B|nr:ricin-type beta-trefoil lectin domain protein [Streptomyces brevispora]
MSVVLLFLVLGRPAGMSENRAVALLDGPGAPGGKSGSQVCGRTMVGVAHEDDDLLFVNPEMQRAMGPQCAFSTVYLTAGDAGRSYTGADYVQEREEGVRAAYAEMAGVPDRWTRHDVHVGTRTIASYTLNGRTGVRLSFLRLPDGNPVGSGYPRHAHQSLLKLFRGEIRDIRPVDGAQSYTEGQLIDSLTALARQDGIRRVLTLDYDNTSFGHTYTPGADHSDHGVAARYFRRVAFGLPDSPRIGVTGYLGYDMSRLPENLGPILTRQKDAIFQSYRRGAGCESKACPPGHYMGGKYLEWVRREYSLKPPTSGPGEIVSAIGRANGAGRHELCLGSVGDAKGAPEAMEVGTSDCNGRADQSWRINAGTIESKGARLCLTAKSRRVTLLTCDGRPHQEWRQGKDGRIQSAVMQSGGGRPSGDQSGGDEPSGSCLFQDDLAVRHPRLLLGPCSPLRPELSWYGGSALPAA